MIGLGFELGLSQGTPKWHDIWGVPGMQWLVFFFLKLVQERTTSKVLTGLWIPKVDLCMW